MSNTIVKQSIEVSLVYCANRPMGVSSPMSKTRSKQGRYCSNGSKTIEKQGIEGRLGCCANGTMGVNSPISKTKSKIGSDGKWRDLSNVSKTIDKQGINEVWNIVPRGQ